MITYLLDNFYITVNQPSGTDRHIVTRHVDRQGRDVPPFPPQLERLLSSNKNDVDGMASGRDPGNPKHGWLFRLDSASNTVQWDIYAEGTWNIATGVPTILHYTAVTGHAAVALAYNDQQLYIVFRNTTAPHATYVQRYNIGTEETTGPKYRERRLEEYGAPASFPGRDTIVDIVYLAGGLSALVESSSPQEYQIRWYNLLDNPLTPLPQVHRTVVAFVAHINTRDDVATGNTPGLTIDDRYNYVVDDGSGVLYQYPYAIPINTRHPVKVNVQSDENYLYYTATDRHGTLERQRLNAQFTEPTEPMVADTRETSEIVFDANTFANDAEFIRYQRETGRFLPERPITFTPEDRVFKVQTHSSGRDIRQALRISEHEWRISETWQYYGSTEPPKDVAYVEAAGYPEYHFLYDTYIDVYKDPGVEDHLQAQLSYWGRVNLPTARTFDTNHLVVFDNHYYILDRTENEVVALTMPSPRNAQGDLLSTAPTATIVDAESFKLFPQNNSPDGLARDINNNGWYVGNLDPPAIFLYDIDLHLPVWKIDATYLFKQLVNTAISTITIDSNYVTGHATAGPITLSVHGTAPSWLTLSGLTGSPPSAPHGSTLTGTFPDTVENRITITATNNDGSTSKTFYFRKPFPPVWQTARTYKYLLVNPYELVIPDIREFVTWPNTNVYPQHDPPVRATTAIPSWLTFTTQGRLSGTIPATKTHDSVTFRAENSDFHADKIFRFDSAKLLALDFGTHKRRGRILRINLANGTTTTIYDNFAPNTTGDWRSLAAHNGYLWSINNATNRLTRIAIRGTQAVTEIGVPIGTGDWKGLVYENGHFYTIDADTNRLYRFTDNPTSAATLVLTIPLHRAGFTRGILAPRGNPLPPGNVGEFNSLSAFNGKLYTILNRFLVRGGRFRRVPDDSGDVPPERQQASLYCIDLATGSTTVIGQINRRGFGLFLNWHSLTTIGNTLYALDNLRDDLWRIDPTDASSSSVVRTNPAPLGWQGMAVLEDPP